MTTSNTAGAPPGSRGRALTATLWVVQILLAALYAFAAIPKLIGVEGAIQGFEAIGFGQWFRYLTGALELAGAIGLLVPRLAALAALGLAGVMVGAVFAHLLALPPASVAIVPATLFVILLLVARARWPELRIGR